MGVDHVGGPCGPRFPPLDVLQRGIRRAKSCVPRYFCDHLLQKTGRKEQCRCLVRTTHSDFRLKTLNWVLHMLNQRSKTRGPQKVRVRNQPNVHHSPVASSVLATLVALCTSWMAQRHPKLVRKNMGRLNYEKRTAKNCKLWL